MSKSILCTGRKKADVLVDLSYLYIFFVFFYFPYSCNFLLLSKYIATNIVAFIYPDGTVEEQPLMSKDELAERIIERVIAICEKKKR